MERLIIENIRCFSGRHDLRIKPLTILVGENSTGKSTFLALVKLAWSIVRGEPKIDFNEEPFYLGSFDQIATFRGGRAGRAKFFRIGFKFSFTKALRRQKENVSATIEGLFKKKGAQPHLESWTLFSDDLKVQLIYNQESDSPKFIISAPSGEIVSSKFPYFRPPVSVVDILGYITFQLKKEPIQKGILDFDGKAPNKSDLNKLNVLIHQLRIKQGFLPYAFAPIRTCPLRTYDPLREDPNPEGTHVPMILAKKFAASSKEWNILEEQLIRFGKVSGLFNAIKVKRMGSKESDPFQIRVKTFGPTFNMIDVGYGVSQALPILVDCLTRDENTFLLQQPEVHLHPRAQAELGSFLGMTSKIQKKKFVIETHSDYLLDRIRMDIRDKKFIKPDDVEILYFEPGKEGVKIYEIGIDKYGNVVTPPIGYRNFFLEEEDRFFKG